MRKIQTLFRGCMLEFFPFFCTKLHKIQRKNELDGMKMSTQLFEEVGFQAEQMQNFACTERSRLLIVAPASEVNSSRWNFGKGAIFFEILKSAHEVLEIDVELFTFDSEKNLIQEFDRLCCFLICGQFTHLLTNLESDPGRNGWTWDYFAQKAQKSWQGSVIGLSLDGVYRLHQLRFERFINLFPKTVIANIDIVIDGKYLESRNHQGPTLLPISKKSISVIDAELSLLSDIKNRHDVGFVGTMYDYRKHVIARIEQLGLSVAINPSSNKSENNTDLSRGYISYVDSLRHSRFSLNLSRSNGMNVKQLKSRVLESPIFGTPVLSDEKKLMTSYFSEKSDFLFFEPNSASIKRVVKAINNQSDYLEMAMSAKVKARAIAQSAFWDTIQIACDKLGQPITN